MKAIELRITGRVQGVSFRASTRVKALELGLSGWVRNEPDRSVRAFAQGSNAAVQALAQWCEQGPTYAEVNAVDIRSAEPDGSLTTFAILGKQQRTIRPATAKR